MFKLKDKYDEWLEYLKQQGYSKGTIIEYKRHIYGSLSHSVQDIKLNKLTLADCALVQEGGRRHGRYGPLRALSAFRRFLKYLKDKGYEVPFDYRDIDLSEAYVPSPEIIALTPEERQMFLDAAMDYHPGKFHVSPTTSNYRRRALLETLYSTGLRIGEASWLMRDRVPWDTRELRVKNNKVKARGEKEGKEQSVFFNDSSLWWLKRYMDRRHDNSPWLFVTLNGKERWTEQDIRHDIRACSAIQTVEKKIGKHFHCHIMRKCFATDLLINGVDIQTVKHLGRWESERTMLRYYAAVHVARAKDEHQRVMNAV